MNIKLIKFLSALCAGLCLVIFCEWLYSVYAQKQLLASVQAVDNKKKTAATLPSLELAKQPEASYTELVTRPLFIQGRKPVDEPVNTKTTTSVATANFDWALNGVYTHKNGLYALLSRTNKKVTKDNFRKITKNAEIDGWKLTEIYKDKVVVSQGGQQKELQLRKAKPKNPTNIPAPPPMTPPPMPIDPSQQQMIPGQPPIPGQMPGQIPEQIPEPPIPEQVPEMIPEDVQDPMMEPELVIPDQSSDPYFENSTNEQFQ